MIYDQENFTITTDRLLLRRFTLQDAEEVAKLCNNYNIYKNTLYIPYPYSLADAVKWIKTHSKKFKQDLVYEFAVTDKKTGILFGAISLSNNKTFHHGEVGYWLGEDYWNNGYATEAAKAIVQFAFSIKNFHRVYARHFLSNPASGKVLKKIGMKQEGILREHIKKDGNYEDLVFYGILKRDWHGTGI